MYESQAAAEGQSTKQKEQATPAAHDEDDSGQNTSPTMLSILSALQASVTSSNSLLHERLPHGLRARRPLKERSV